MTFYARSLLIAATAAVALAGPLAAVRPAAAQTKLKVVLNWKYQGPQGMFFLAEDKGYFKAEGIDVQLDQGNGSGAPIALVANGTYDVGFGDMNTLIEFAAKKPDEAPVAVYAMYNQPPFSIAVKADSPIKTPKDLEGKTIGIATGSAQFQQWPAFMKGVGLDSTKVRVVNVDGAGAGPALISGQIDAVGGFAQGYIPGIEIRGKKKVRAFWYADEGVTAMSNGIIVHQDLLTETDLIRGMVRASLKGFLYGRAHPDELTAIVKKYSETTDMAITLREAQLSWNTWVTPTTANKPLGWMSADDWASTVAVLKAYGGVTTPLEAADLFNNDFVPAEAEFIPPQSA
jgi:NitT/TauT family transport system substrate-binding protein